MPIGISPSVLVVSPAGGMKSAADLVAAAKARPNALNFSSVGIGSATHLSAERFRSSAAVQAVHIPFKGGAEAMTEVIAGRVDFFFGRRVVLPTSGSKLAALAVNMTSALRLPTSPLREAGFRDAEYPLVRLFARRDAARDRRAAEPETEGAAGPQGSRDFPRSARSDPISPRSSRRTWR